MAKDKHRSEHEVNGMKFIVTENPDRPGSTLDLAHEAREANMMASLRAQAGLAAPKRQTVRKVYELYGAAEIGETMLEPPAGDGWVPVGYSNSSTDHFALVSVLWTREVMA